MNNLEFNNNKNFKFISSIKLRQCFNLLAKYNHLIPINVFFNKLIYDNLSYQHKPFLHKRR